MMKSRVTTISAADCAYPSAETLLSLLTFHFSREELSCGQLIDPVILDNLRRQTPELPIQRREPALSNVPELSGSTPMKTDTK
jgi:hypothetical protein